MHDRRSRPRRGTRLAARASLLAAVVLLGLPAAADAARVPVTVAITSVTNINAGDIFDGPDFLIRINIANGAWFSTTSIPNTATPNTATWTHTATVSATATGGTTPVRIELLDDDGIFGNDVVDVDPGVCPPPPLFGAGCATLAINRPAFDYRGQDLTVNVRTGTFVGVDTPTGGDSTGTTGTTPTCVTGTESGAATMCFTITLGTPIADILVVTKTADTNDGLCTLTDCSLREAIAAADPGDTVRVPDLGGPYRLSFWDPGDPSGEPGHLKITKALTIRGPPTGATIQQTRPDARVFEVHGGGNLDLSNFTLTGGEAGNNSTAVPGHIHGGAIHNHGVVSLENVTITGNHARSTTLESVGGGGGFYNAGTASFTNVTIVGNDASVRAGGIAGNPVTLHNTLIADNTGANGNCQSAETNGGGNLEYAGATCGVPVAARAPIGPLPIGGVFELLPGSEAIDAGTGTAPPACPAIDEIGGARPLDGDGDGAARCDTGAIEFDPTGIGVIHQPLDGSGGRGPVTVTFDNVTTAGTTTLHVSGSGPAPPAGYRPVAYYDLSTTAVFTGGVRVCADWSGQTVADESAVRLFRHTGGAWTDATVSLDTAANVVCGRATSLGVFAVLGANRPPTASVDEPAGGYTVTEGGAVTLQGRGTDPDGDALTYAWTPTADLSDPAAATPVLSPRDEGDRTLRLVVSDGESTSPPATVTVRVANAPPGVTVTSPAPGVAHRAGSLIALAASFTDPGPDDVHSCTITWDDGSAPEPGAVTESSGTCARTHTFARPGTYTVRVTVDDGDGGSDSASTLVVVHDPRPRLVAGGGALTSPPGAYRAQPAVAHVGLFAVTATYRPGATAPIGLTTFRLLGTGLTFRSSAYDWLVISGARAQLHGAGRIGGSGSYGFLLTVADAGTSGDRLRMKIWDRSAGDRVVYDNVLDPAATDDLDSARPRPISAGGIAVQPGP